MKRIGIYLVSWGIGGSEKRFGNLFNYLSTHSSDEYTLLINRFLLNNLARIGINIPRENAITLLDTRWNKWTDRPSINFNNKFDFRIPGLNFLAYYFFEYAHYLGLRMGGRLLSELDFDVVHYVFPYFADAIGKSRAQVLSCQDTNLRKTLLKNKFFLKALHNNGYFDIASERLRKIICDETGISDERRLWVNPCSFIDYRKTYIAPKEPLIVFLGNFYPVKNPLLFVKIIQQIINYHKNLKAIMLGDGPLKNEIKRLVHQYNLEDYITIQFHPNPEEILSRALIFVSIQNHDNYHSQALMEAMACGCAIVASDFGETYKLVSHEVGFRVSLEVDEISEKILWLLNNQALAQTMGLNARKKVMREQTIERFSAYLEELYAAAGS